MEAVYEYPDSWGTVYAAAAGQSSDHVYTITDQVCAGSGGGGGSVQINGGSCPSSAVVVTASNCIQGAPHYDPEGMVCANDNTATESYCSYEVGAAACAYCSGSGLRDSGTPSRARRLVTNNTRDREATAEPTSTLGSLLTGLFEYFSGNHDAEGARKSAHVRGTLSKTLPSRSAMGHSGHADTVERLRKKRSTTEVGMPLRAAKRSRRTHGSGSGSGSAYHDPLKIRFQCGWDSTTSTCKTGETTTRAEFMALLEDTVGACSHLTHHPTPSPTTLPTTEPTTSEPNASNLAPTVSPTATADLTAGRSSTDDSADPAVVAGAVVGVIAVLALITALVVVLRTKRQHDRDAGSIDMKLNRTASHAMKGGRIDRHYSNQCSVSSADSVASPDRALDNMPYEAEAHCAEAVNSEVDELVGDAMSDDAAAAQAFQNSMMERKMQVGTEGDLRLVSVRRTNPLGPDSPTAAPALADLPDSTCPDSPTAAPAPADPPDNTVPSASASARPSSTFGQRDDD